MNRARRQRLVRVALFVGALSSAGLGLGVAQGTGSGCGRFEQLVAWFFSRSPADLAPDISTWVYYSDPYYLPYSFWHPPDWQARSLGNPSARTVGVALTAADRSAAMVMLAMPPPYPGMTPRDLAAWGLEALMGESRALEVLCVLDTPPGPLQPAQTQIALTDGQTIVLVGATLYAVGSSEAIWSDLTLFVAPEATFEQYYTTVFARILYQFFMGGSGTEDGKKKKKKRNGDGPDDDE
ncbi:hypothetical protein [Marinithermus hydrothermalis]|uniref:Uncharacterized protein n=1 Tax=Marinithermus hydrothermalis (strain DSM 14884 / JCM 11576 / T1) TaxID=869210 RepID=F2NPC0_MARHT|nr:hypothetical protein [Marinithermus hydrothermalis]AEB12201.1 hypothetical protein Marky_1466 [Marinithermus hydrothermalis DSM 14884]